MDRHLSQIAVSSLADPQEPRFAASRHLPRDQTKPSGKISSTAECLRIVDRRYEGRGVQRADTRDRGQKPTGLIRTRIDLELLVKCRDAACVNRAWRAVGGDLRAFKLSQIREEPAPASKVSWLVVFGEDNKHGRAQSKSTTNCRVCPEARHPKSDRQAHTTDQQSISSTMRCSRSGLLESRSRSRRSKIPKVKRIEHQPHPGLICLTNRADIRFRLRECL